MTCASVRFFGVINPKPNREHHASKRRASLYLKKLSAIRSLFLSRSRVQFDLQFTSSRIRHLHHVRFIASISGHGGVFASVAALPMAAAAAEALEPDSLGSCKPGWTQAQWEALLLLLRRSGPVSLAASAVRSRGPRRDGRTGAAEMACLSEEEGGDAGRLRGHQLQR